ncbi:hypothetical protein ACFLYI_01645 [Chloroflexota bacterium]
MIKCRLYFGIIILVVLVVSLVGCSGTQSQKPTVPSPSLLAPAPVPPTGGGTPLAPTTGEPEPATPLQIEVAIEGYTFNPAILPPPPLAPSSLPPNAPAPAPAPNLPVGVTIVWYNNDSVDHTITARNNLFDSGSLSPSDTFRYTFAQPGELEYYCKIHPSMVGKITIE